MSGQCTSCKHVHLVSRVSSQRLHTSTASEDTCIFGPKEKSNAKKEITELLQYVNTGGSAQPVEQSTSELKKQLCGALQRIAARVMHGEDTVALQELYKGIIQKENLYISMEEHKNVSQLKIKERCPSNKKTTPQRRFFSTKKKRKRSNNIRYAKPTSEEKECLFLDTGNGN